MNLLQKLQAIEKAPQKAVPQQEEQFIDCWQQTIIHPFSEFPEYAMLRRAPLMLMQHEELPEPLKPRQILFLDTETTGLGGGAGTVAFEVGVGRVTSEGFAVTQYVMRDYPEERFMLEKVRQALLDSQVLCTFNGKTFDLPLLRSRLIMNRIRDDCLDIPHIDLLHIARRIYKLRLQQCRLSQIEEQVLGIPREDDLPGSEAPDRFFRYLQTRDFSLLEDVLRHNDQDVASMLMLLSHLCAQYTQPEQISFGEDLFSMGKALEKEKHTQESRHVYHPPRSTLFPYTTLFRSVPTGKMHASSQLHLARSYRRNGDPNEAKSIYLTMIERHEGGVEPYIALAKHYEHVENDLVKAMEMTRRAIFLMSEPSLLDSESVQETRNALQYRYDRLRKRLTRKGL